MFDNWVYNNKVIDNGTFVVPPTVAAARVSACSRRHPAAASYDNTVIKNYIVGSGQSGVTIHAHYTGGEYVSGNRIVQNYIGTNNVGGDGLDGPSTDPDFSTTGILIFSAVHVDMVIACNHIWDNQIGIWLSADVNAHGLGSNSISGCDHRDLRLAQARGIHRARPWRAPRRPRPSACSLTRTGLRRRTTSSGALRRATPVE